MSKRHNYGCACRTCAIERNQFKPSAKPFWKIAQEITDSIPPEEWAKLEPGVYDVNDALDKLKVARAERDSARRFAKAWKAVARRLRSHQSMKWMGDLRAENAALEAERDALQAENAALKGVLADARSYLTRFRHSDCEAESVLDQIAGVMPWPPLADDNGER